MPVYHGSDLCTAHEARNVPHTATTRSNKLHEHIAWSTLHDLRAQLSTSHTSHQGSILSAAYDSPVTEGYTNALCIVTTSGWDTTEQLNRRQQSMGQPFRVHTTPTYCTDSPRCAALPNSELYDRQ